MEMDLIWLLTFIMKKLRAINVLRVSTLILGALLGSCPFWFMLSFVRPLFCLSSFLFMFFLIRAVFGSCPIWFVLFLICALFVRALFGPCPIWLVLFLIRALFGQTAFWRKGDVGSFLLESFFSGEHRRRTSKLKGPLLQQLPIYILAGTTNLSSVVLVPRYTAFALEKKQSYYYYYGCFIADFGLNSFSNNYFGDSNC